jgi:hypothetical protein
MLKPGDQTARAVAGSVRVQHPQSQQFDACSAVHLSLQKLQPVDVPLSLPVAPWR